MAIKKKWIENKEREFSWGINPHSKGLNFSKSSKVFFFTENITMTRIIAKIKIINTTNLNIKIK